jgi:phosphodiesterase/alkaline phosphatase D-like protein
MAEPRSSRVCADLRVHSLLESQFDRRRFLTMLGKEQENWLLDGLATSQPRWNVIGSNVMMARLGHDGDAGQQLFGRCVGPLPSRA